MKVRNKTDFPFVPLLGRVNHPAFAATCTVKATFALNPGGVVTALEEQPQFDGDVKGEKEILYAGDLVPYKPVADLLLRATCHTPGGKAVTTCPVRFSVGGWSKELAVIGNRTWNRGIVFNKMGEPEPFNRVDLTWANAFGGEGFVFNPAGKGRKDGLLPNVEYPTELVKGPGNIPPPASFGPIDATWRQRAKKLGTYDKKWLKQRWPALPADLDWTYFNAASEDQQVEFLRGDEAIALVNMHPEHPELKTQLPGLRMRCVVRLTPEKGEALVEREVPMNLDTLYVDAQKALVTMIWRGVCDVRMEEAEDLADVLVFSESLHGTPATMEQIRPWFEEEPEEAEPAPPPPPPEDTTAMEGEALAEAFKNLAQQQVATLKSKAPASHADMISMAPAAFTGFGDARKGVAEAMAKLTSMGRTVPPELANLAAKLDDPEVTQAETDMLIATALATLPPVVALRGKQLAAAIKKRETPDRDFANAELSGEDLSGSDLNQANFTGAKLDGVDFTGCQLDGALFNQADLTGAKFGGVKAEGISFTGAKLQDADFTGAVITDALFDRVSGSGLLLAGAELPGASFNKADIAGVNAEAAKLDAADFSSADVSGGNFVGASVAEALFADANAAGANFSKCKGALRGSDGNFKGANFEEAEIEGAIFENANLEEANFRYAAVKGGMLVNANLSGAVLFGAVLRQGSLRKANLSGAQAGNADFFQCDFEKANLNGASMIAGNCYEAAFRDADTRNADFSDTILKGTLLAK